MPEQTQKRPFGFKIGADPEFNLVMQGKKIDASQTIQMLLKDKPEFRQRKEEWGLSGYDINPFGNIGWDRQSSTAEIRPRAAHCPQEVVENIRGIFTAFSKHTSLFDFSTLSEFDPIGGHIHLELPKGKKWEARKENDIHRKLSSFYLPLLLGENKINLTLRIRRQYGTLAERRIEPKFTHPDGSPGYTYEFRCPSAEWLTTPRIANATLAYFGVIYHEILNHPTHFRDFKEFTYKSDSQGDAIQTLAIMEYNMFSKHILKTAKKFIRTFEMYPDYKEEIEFIMNPMKVMNEKEKAEFNIILGWNLGTPKVTKKKDILSTERRVQGIISKLNLDQVKGFININYNKDTKVPLFAEKLKERVLAFNWRLKNNYYLFGMRKGIDKMIVKNSKGDYLDGEDLLKTKMDKYEMDNLFERMSQRFLQEAPPSDNFVVDFKTQKVRGVREAMIFIGIPYEMRVREDITPFLELIWSIENGEKIPSDFNHKEGILIDDSGVPNTERGEIWKILTKFGEKRDEIVYAKEHPDQRQVLGQVAGEQRQRETEEAINNN